MKLVALALPLLAAFAPAVGAQTTPGDVAKRVAIQIQEEVQFGTTELDSAFVIAERRLYQMAERGASERVLREYVVFSGQKFHTTTMVCTRTIRTFEAKGLDVLTEMGAYQYWIPWLQHFTDRELGALESHEAAIAKRLELVLETLL
jgi:hypothetical protein